MQFCQILDLPPVPPQLLNFEIALSNGYDIGYGLTHTKNGTVLLPALWREGLVTHTPLVEWVMANISGLEGKHLTYAQTEHPTGGYHIVHSDIKRKYSLNYYVDLGGDEVITRWYQEKNKPLHRYRDTRYMQSDTGRVYYDDLIELESIVCKKHTWYLFTNDVLHDAGPIVGKRSFISFTVMDPTKILRKL